MAKPQKIQGTIPVPIDLWHRYSAYRQQTGLTNGEQIELFLSSVEQRNFESPQDYLAAIAAHSRAVTALSHQLATRFGSPATVDASKSAA